MTIVAIMTVRSTAAETFRAFERRAAAVMADHGGAIERTVVIPGDHETFREIHIVTFPGPTAFEAYRRDERLREAAPLRDASVIATEIMIGEDGPEYRIRGS
jgi:hypothetical protein